MTRFLFSPPAPKLAWVAILYFAQGLPVGLPFSVYFRAHGMSLEEIGLLSLTSLPWALKFVWAPAVDLRGKRRTWIVVCQATAGAQYLPPAGV